MEHGIETHKPAILVTGGSGYIGQHLVRKLSEKKETVVSMYRHRLPEPQEGVFPVCSDMSSTQLLAAPLRGVNTVVHLAWERSLIGPPTSTLPKGPHDFKHFSRNLRQLENLLRAMEKAATERIVFVSAIGAGQGAKEQFLKEKYLAELLILNSKVPEKIIVRPSVIFGGHSGQDRFIRSIIKIMKFPGFYPVPSKKESLSPLHIEDLTKFLHRLCHKKLEDPVSVIDITGGESYKIDELFKLVSDYYAKGSRFAVRNLIGNSLVSLMERESNEDTTHPKLRHFLALGGHTDKKVRLDNPLAEEIPENLLGFKKMLFNNAPSEFSQTKELHSTKVS